jgi:hypothetical protein
MSNAFNHDHRDFLGTATILTIAAGQLGVIGSPAAQFGKTKKPTSLPPIKQ